MSSIGSPIESLPNSRAELQQQLSKMPRPIRWVGALSFEERCRASITRLRELDIHIEEVVLFEYDTAVFSQSEDRRRREQNYTAISDYAAKFSVQPLRRREVSPYAFQEIEPTISSIAAETRDGTIILDVTCLTKIHAIALAAVLASSEAANTWLVCYSSPENYGALGTSQDKFGWRDVIVAPIGEVASSTNETTSRGILIPGHESNRLLMALSEVEPSGGTIFIAEFNKQADLRVICERNNRRIVEHLLRLRASQWEKQIIDSNNLQKVSDLVAREVQYASAQKAPLFLFPFGPKAMIFAATFELALRYRQATWFVYPIPTAYDVNYTEGIGATRWLIVGRRPLVSSTH